MKMTKTEDAYQRRAAERAIEADRKLEESKEYREQLLSLCTALANLRGVKLIVRPNPDGSWKISRLEDLDWRPVPAPSLWAVLQELHDTVYV